MTIFFRYIFRQAASALLIILLSLGGVVWIALALKQLNVVTSQGQNALTFITMTTLALPSLIAVIAPFALLIAVVHTLNRLNSDSELIVITASGANAWVAGRPLIVLGVVVMVGVGLISHFLMPWSVRTLKQMIVEVRTDLLTQVIQPGRFSSPERGLTFHIKDRTFEGELLGLVVEDRRTKGEAQAYLAERARILSQDDSKFLLMQEGHIIRRKVGDGGAQIIVFDRYIVDLDQFDKKGPGSAFLKPKARYFHELMNPDPDDPYFKSRPGKFRAELHERFAGPLYPIAFVLIAIALMGQARSNRQGRMEGLVLAIGAGFALRLVGLAINNLVAVDAAFVPVLYAVPLGGMTLAVVAIIAGTRPRRGPSVGQRLGALFEPLSRLWPQRRKAESPPAAGAALASGPTLGHGATGGRR